jgi:competence ComEA-like helix-hairpin-helix protein
MHSDTIDIRQNRIQSFAFVISIFIAAVLSLFFYSNLRDNYQNVNEHETKLESRINPNNAPTASLVRLPGIGLLRAQAIVEYRENFTKKNSNVPAFQDINDLQKIKGIGPKTAQDMAQWLTFE